MKISTSALRVATDNVVRFAAQKSTVPIYTHFLLDSRDGTLKVCAFDSEGSCVWDTGEPSNGDAIYVTVPAKIFHGDIHGITDDEVDLSVVKHKLVVKTPRHRAEFDTLPGDEFLMLPSHGDFHEVDSRIVGALEKCAITINAKQEVLVLTGVYLRVTDGQIEVYGTDGVRAGRYSVDYSDDAAFEVIIPKRVASNIAKSDHIDGRLLLATDERTLTLKTPQATFTSQLLDGRYPQVWTFFNRDLSGYHKVTVNGMDLFNTLKRAMIFVTKMDRYILLDITPSTLTVRTSTYNHGFGEIEIDARSEITITIAINIEYFNDYVRIAKNTEIIIMIGNETDPVYMSGPENFTYVMMPMRIR